MDQQGRYLHIIRRMKTAALMTAFLCLFAMNLFCQPKDGPANQPKNHTEKAAATNNNSEADNHNQTTQPSPPKWYTSLKRPEWWIVIIAAVTAIFICWQAAETRHATQAMRDSIPHQETAASAALASAQALINSERAWVMADVGWQSAGLKRFKIDSDDQRTHAAVNIFCRNAGRAVAWITEKGGILKLVDSLPQEPDFSQLDIFHDEPEPLVPGDEPSKFEYLAMCNGWHADGSGKMLVFYGRVKYRDTFGDHRETRFGYRIGMDNQLERLSGYPEYNKNA